MTQQDDGDIDVSGNWSLAKFFHEMLKQSWIWRNLVIGFLSGFAVALFFVLIFAKGAVLWLSF